MKKTSKGVNFKQAEMYIHTNNILTNSQFICCHSNLQFFDNELFTKSNKSRQTEEVCQSQDTNDVIHSQNWALPSVEVFKDFKKCIKVGVLKFHLQ